MNIKITLLLLFLVQFFKLHSQTVEPSATIEKYNLQIEFESLYTIQKEENVQMNSWSIPSILFRYGLTNNLELQLNTPIIKEQLWEHDHLIHNLNKFDDVQLGFSLNLWKGHHIIPKASLLIRTILPTSTNFALKNIGKICSLNLSNSLSKDFILTYNIGYAIETDATKTGFYIANLTYNASDSIHFFVENFGDFQHAKLISHNINYGGGYYFNDKLAFDISIANGINHHMFYVGGLLTWVIQPKK